MSNAIFPTLPGVKWGRTKTPVWSTRIQTAVSGKETRRSYFSYPLWRFSLQYEFLRSGAQQELQQLVGFFNARQGSFDSWLYLDPEDNAAVDQLIGNGDGVTTRFRLARDFGGYIEPVGSMQTDAGLSVTVDGAVASNYTPDVDTGAIVFDTAPLAGAAIRWSGTFYYRCRFLQDSAEFQRFLKNLWSAQKIEFTSVK